jgi:integrase
VTVETITSKVKKNYEDNNDAKNTNDTITKYIKNIRTMSKSTANEYNRRLNNFSIFVSKEYKTNVDSIISKIKEGVEDPYDILSSYIAYLQDTSSISTFTLKQRIVTAKNFFEYYDTDISPRKFKLKVKLPKVVRKDKEALNKEDIIEILNSCSDIRLKTYIMILAAGGFRAVEALSIRVCDVDFDADPVKVFIRGEYTKTKADRFVYLTEESARQLKTWLQYKYRTRRVCHTDKEKGNTITEYRTPTRNDTDLVFSVYQPKNHTSNLRCIYNDLDQDFGKTLDRIGRGNREDQINGRRRKITFHSFRRYVKSTISDLGYQDYSEWFISHSGSTYWRKKESEKVEIFRKVESYLTFLDFVKLDRRGADVQTKVEELEAINQRLREHDTMNTDAISNLSDQVMKLMVEVQELKKQNQ